MTGRCLLDTNIVIALFNGDGAIEGELDAETEVFLPAIVLGELYFGAIHSGRPEANAELVIGFAAICTVVGVDAETALHYGQVKGGLRRKGSPIPENDLWIAACALQHGLTLITRDRHFELVEGLEVEMW